jgi:hypothetical protein
MMTKAEFTAAVRGSGVGDRFSYLGMVALYNHISKKYASHRRGRAPFDAREWMEVEDFEELSYMYGFLWDEIYETIWDNSCNEAWEENPSHDEYTQRGFLRALKGYTPILPTGKGYVVLTP